MKYIYKIFLSLLVLPATPILAQTDYQHFIIYGQSLSTGHDSGTGISLQNVPGNFMFGDQVFIDCSNTNTSTLNPLVSKPATCAPNVIESPIIGFANHLQAKGLINNKTIATVTGHGGTSIEELSKQSAIDNYYNIYTDALTTGALYVRKNKVTINCPAIFYLQGENNYVGQGHGLTEGSTATKNKDEYKALLLTLKDNMQNDAQKNYKQSTKPVFYIYQTGAYMGKVGKELTIGMAQLEASNEYDDIVCMGPLYQMSNYGIHLDANGYRWYGEMMAKIYYRHSILNEEFKPLQPKAIYRDASDKKKVTIQFLVPKLPLVFDDKILEKEADYGFQLFNNGVKQSIKELIIVEDCVEIHTYNNIMGEIEIVYAGETTNTRGNGNLRDNDDYQSVFTYVDLDEKDNEGNYIYSHLENKALRPTYEPKDENGNIIYGKPYPLYNFCVSFYYKLPKDEDRLDINLSNSSSIATPQEDNGQIAFYANKSLYVDSSYNVKHIVIYDLSGKKKFSSTISDSNKFDLSFLEKGSYIVQLSAEKNLKNIKIIVD
ncbi:MAG: T9SS type A sorting domain-containing protein [Dysgonomonas sp.]